MCNSPIFRPDPERRPSFLEGSVVILTKDYTRASHNFTGNFEKDEVCKVDKCGLSLYNYTDDGKYRKSIGGVEWCSVEICGMDEEPDECCVKAEDLRELTDVEFESGLSRIIF